MKKLLLPIISVFFLSSSLFSQVLYSSTAYTSRFNPGVGAHGTPIVAYDDVTIPSAIAAGGDSISITKVNIGIRRMPNAPATNVNIYYTTFTHDSTGVDLVKGPKVFLGKVSLSANGNVLATSVTSLGDSVTALFKMKAETTADYQKFLVGASFDNPSPLNGIILTREAANNANSLWIDNSGNDKSLYATSFNSHTPASYYLEVFGTGARKQPNVNRSLYSDVAVQQNAGITTVR